MNTISNIEEKVINFFRDKGIYDESKDRETVINSINLDYFDAIDIFEDFLIKFDIEKGYENFNIKKYFYKVTFLDSFRLMINRPVKNVYAIKSSITIAHMIEVAKRKEWFDPE